MRKMMIGIAATAAMLGLAGCGGGKLRGVTGHAGPDEFAVARRAPLVVPPDFALVPPKPGAPRPQEADSGTLALQAMFGGPSLRSPAEAALTDQAGIAEGGIRSTAADPGTTMVNKGGATRDILTAPEQQNPEATATTPK
jgi:hypothetical protein